jgi:hypothetical protein
MPGWAYGKTYSNDISLWDKPEIDRCINCGDQKEVKTKITMEFGEGNYNTGPICKKCYSGYVTQQYTYQEF